MTRLPRWGNLGLGRSSARCSSKASVLLLGLATGLLARSGCARRSRRSSPKRGPGHRRATCDVLGEAAPRRRPGDAPAVRQPHDEPGLRRSVAVLDAEGAVVMHSDLAALGNRPEDSLSRAAVASHAPGYDKAGLAGAARPSTASSSPSRRRAHAWARCCWGTPGPPPRPSSRARGARSRGPCCWPRRWPACSPSSCVVHRPPGRDHRRGPAARVGRGGEGRARHQEGGRDRRPRLLLQQGWRRTSPGTGDT